jgi:hypothetical protein
MSTGRLFEGWMPTVVSLRRVCKRHCLMHNVDVMRGVSSQGGVRAVVRVAKASRPPRAPGRAAQCRQAHTHTPAPPSTRLEASGTGLSYLIQYIRPKQGSTTPLESIVGESRKMATNGRYTMRAGSLVPRRSQTTDRVLLRAGHELRL